MALCSKEILRKITTRFKTTHHSSTFSAAAGATSLSPVSDRISTSPPRTLFRLSRGAQAHQSGFKAYSTSANIYPNIYPDVFKQSIENPQEFWAEAAAGVSWHKKWDRVLDDDNSPFTKWFPGGELNMCYNAVDRHVEAGHGGQVAIIHDSPVTKTIKNITYQELQQKVSKLAYVLQKHGVVKGDRVLIYMPMIPEAIIAMLASARIGAIHSLVFGGFASKELATRINHAKPKVVVSANAGKEPSRVVEYKPLLDAALEMSVHKPSTCIIYNRVHKDEFTPSTMVAGRDKCWEEEMAGARSVDPVPILATDPLYILYTSGTTGAPKAVVRPCGGHAVVLNWSMLNQYGVNKHETWFAASDLGWVVGHSYIVYGPLLHCNTTVLYEGKPIGTPDPGTYFRMMQDHKIVSMFVAPTAMRAVRREDPDGVYAKQYSHPDFRCLFVAGEHCDHETMEWLHERLNTPILDNWWQTETGSAITSTCVGLGNDLYPERGVAGKPVPGWNVKVVRRDLTETDDDELGNIVAKLPLPPGTFSSLWEDPVRFEDLYFKTYEGHYDSMDAGYRDRFGNIAVMARVDDVINVAGHRLSTGQLEEACMENEDIVEAAVVAMKDSIKGHVPLALCVIKPDHHIVPEEVRKGVIATVREHVGPVASFNNVVFVERLPKTRSGKTDRKSMALMLGGEPYKIPVTIEDASVYPKIEKALKSAGYLS